MLHKGGLRRATLQSNSSWNYSSAFDGGGDIYGVSKAGKHVLQVIGAQRLPMSVKSAGIAAVEISCIFWKRVLKAVHWNQFRIRLTGLDARPI